MARPKGRFVTPRDAPRPPGVRPIGRPRKTPVKPHGEGSARVGRPPKRDLPGLLIRPYNLLTLIVIRH